MSATTLPTQLASYYITDVVGVQIKLQDTIKSLEDLHRRLNQSGDDHGLGQVMGKLMVLAANNDETVRGAGLNSVLRSLMDRKDP